MPGECWQARARVRSGRRSMEPMQRLPDIPEFFQSREWIMIPRRIIDHLQSKQIPFKRHPHPRPPSPRSRWPGSIHVSGYRVAKTVLFEAEGERWMAVLPAVGMVDTDRREILDKRNIRLLDEEEFARLFTQCEVGAEPPFGSLFGIPCSYGRIPPGGGAHARAGGHSR